MGMGPLLLEKDYHADTRKVRFRSGSPDGFTAAVWSNLIDDVLVDPNETYSLQITNLVGPATIGTIASHQVTILENDSPDIFYVNQNAAGAGKWILLG